ncbi:uncharacterized protein LAJ45_07231 [Morchella importuna]|uniref:uncharacterized protein n=1 Tax=Morchella importuna TaxID=1174673 RepID=UPI001E8E6B80|nr:uncharacterized protein LAJ45_07231 [Morchella importuna]KAH8148887.1 hypothetical protein LAJ45_07231 [Morchella importuna]
MIELLKEHLGPQLRKYKETSDQALKQNFDLAEFFTDYKERCLAESKGSCCGDTLLDQTYKDDILVARMNTERIISCLQEYAVSLNQQSPDFHHNHISVADQMDVPHNSENTSVLANTETTFNLLQSVSADVNGLLSTFKATNDAIIGNSVLIGDILKRTTDLKSELAEHDATLQKTHDEAKLSRMIAAECRDHVREPVAFESLEYRVAPPAETHTGILRITALLTTSLDRFSGRIDALTAALEAQQAKPQATQSPTVSLGGLSPCPGGEFHDNMHSLATTCIAMSDRLFSLETQMLLIKDMVAHKAPPNANGAPTSVNPVNAVNISSHRDEMGSNVPHSTPTCSRPHTPSATAHEPTHLRHAVATPADLDAVLQNFSQCDIQLEEEGAM